MTSVITGNEHNSSINWEKQSAHNAVIVEKFTTLTENCWFKKQGICPNVTAASQYKQIRT